jgi:DNA-binding GntR family transcriptional regulator
LRTETDVRAVEDLLLAMEALDPAAENFFTAWLDLNRAFHGRLIASARRQRLAAVASNFRDTIEPYVRIESIMTSDFREASLEHREIFEAFRDCAPNRAGALSRDHCVSTMNRLLDGIRRRDAALPIHSKLRTKP